MKTFLTTVAALAILSGPAFSGTTKTAWNMPLDHASNSGGSVTSAESCLQDNSSDTACWNEHDRIADLKFERKPEPEPDESEG